MADGFILQLADPHIAAWTIEAVRARPPRPGATPTSVKICVAAPAYVGDDLAHPRDQCRWFGGMVGNHVADLVARYGEHSAGARGAHRVRRGPQGLRLRRARQGGNPHIDFVPDDIVDRFCLLGPADAHIDDASRSSATLGVDQFAVYLQHDAKEEALQAYGAEILPAFAD